MRLERRSSVYFVISFRVSARAVRATIFAQVRLGSSAGGVFYYTT